MKASEMTNEELAKALMRRVPLDSDSHDDIREASARLCKQDIIVAAQKAKGAAEGYANGCERVADLSRRLKVAEKALQNLQERLVSSVYDGTLNPHEALEIAENAISAIREEWGEMNSKQSVTNCNRFCNAAKMREALENIAEYAKAAECHTEDAHLLGYLNQIAMWAEDALSAPPRNCDVGTTDEQVERFQWFCDTRPCDGCTLKNKVNETLDCAIHWAQMPYEEGENAEVKK